MHRAKRLSIFSHRKMYVKDIPEQLVDERLRAPFGRTHPSGKPRRYRGLPSDEPGCRPGSNLDIPDYALTVTPGVVGARQKKVKSQSIERQIKI